MNYTFYNDTGRITEIVFFSDPDAVSIPDNQQYIQGAFPANEFYIVNGQAAPMPIKPIGEYNFDYVTHQWVLDLAKIAEQTRNQRNQALSMIDRVNPIWYNSLSTEQQQELAAYRQALLDVPQQPGFPAAVEWPVQPAWL